ncbi:MAG TPA: lyase family protein [Bacilli bacterium]|nr:lyase family protein [Bacilli bacterium]
MRYRIEKDSLGEKVIPAESYFGIQTLRSKELFRITKHGQCRQNIKAFAHVKKVVAKTNYEFDFISQEKANAIILSADEILNGRLHGQFVTDSIQDGYGMGMNMNACEVIANRANEMLGGEKGRYDKVHPIDDVNLNQDNEEVVVLTGKITTIRLVKKLMTEAKKLVNAYYDKIEQAKLVKDDPNSFGYQLASMASILEKDIKRLDKALDSMLDIHFGLALNIEDGQRKEEYLKKFVKNLTLSNSENYSYSKNTFDSARSLNGFMMVSSVLKNMIVNFSKVASDLKTLSIAGQIKIPQVQDFLTFEDNNVVLDMVRQISFYIMGNDLTVSRAVEEGNLGINVFKPMIYACLFESINLIRRTIRTVRENVVEPMLI